MSYWTRATLQDSVESQTDTGATIYAFSDWLADAEVRVLPLTVQEGEVEWARPEEDTYEVQFRGAVDGIRPRMRVVVDSTAYDIRRVLEPPPFGTPTTVVWAVKVTP